MNKNELKKMLKPLIKECIKEVMFEDGTLSTIISEVMKGTSTSRPIVENRQPAKQQPRLENDNEAKARIQAKQKKLMEAMGVDAYNGVNLFEGTSPTTSPSTVQGQGALQGVAANDPGIDITKLMNKTTAIWQKMNEKK